MPATLVAWFAASYRMSGAARILLVLIALAFMCNAALAVYHAGAEWKWWPGPDTCSGSFNLTWGEGGVVDTPIIRCDEASWRFLWRSLPGTPCWPVSPWSQPSARPGVPDPEADPRSRKIQGW